MVLKTMIKNEVKQYAKNTKDGNAVYGKTDSTNLIPIDIVAY